MAALDSRAPSAASSRRVSVDRWQTASACALAVRATATLSCAPRTPPRGAGGATRAGTRRRPANHSRTARGGTAEPRWYMGESVRYCACAGGGAAPAPAPASLAAAGQPRHARDGAARCQTEYGGVSSDSYRRDRQRHYRCPTPPPPPHRTCRRRGRSRAQASQDARGLRGGCVEATEHGPRGTMAYRAAALANAAATSATPPLATAARTQDVSASWAQSPVRATPRAQAAPLSLCELARAASRDCPAAHSRSTSDGRAPGAWRPGERT